MKKKKINEEFIKPKFDKEKQSKIVDDFCNLASKITGISKEEFEDFKKKVRSGEIKLDNDV
jgi:hypothetical protein